MTVHFCAHGARSTFTTRLSTLCTALSLCLLGFGPSALASTIPSPSVLDIQGQVDGVPVGPVGVNHTITSADVGKTLVFIVRYTIPTDDDACFGVNSFLCPNIVFNNTGGTPLSLSNATSEWLTRSRYKVTWTIADGDEQFDSIDLTIAGGVGRADDPSNKNGDTPLSAVFSIDTKHPTVSFITSSTTAVSSGAPVSGLVTLAVSYSHPMDTSSTPTFSFPNQDLGSSLTPVSGTWTDNQGYAQTYRVAATGVHLSSVDVKVTGARRPNGNVQRDATFAGVFSINLPTPSATLASMKPLSPVLPGVDIMPGSTLDASCCGDIFVRTLSKALNTPLTLIGYGTNGSVVLDGFQGARLAFVATGVAPGDSRADGLYAVGDGSYQVVDHNVAATIVPALVDVGQLAGLLPPGSTVQFNTRGILTATVNGLTYVLLPSAAVQRVASADGKPSLVTGSDGYLHFQDAAGNRQTLFPAFLEPQTLRSYLQAIDIAAGLTIQLDGSAQAQLLGQRLVLVPDSTLGGVPAAMPQRGWLQRADGHFLFLNQIRSQTTQGLGLLTQ